MTTIKHLTSNYNIDHTNAKTIVDYLKESYSSHVLYIELIGEKITAQLTTGGTLLHEMEPKPTDHLYLNAINGKRQNAEKLQHWLDN